MFRSKWCLLTGLITLTIGKAAHAAIVATMSALTPAPGLMFSLPNYAAGGQVIASARVTNSSSQQAVVWSPNASGIATGVSLNPTGYRSTFAYGTDGTRQVGVGFAAAGLSQALLWSGTAASVVNLTPTTATAAGTYAVRGTRQGGYVQPTGVSAGHAAVWSGTADSAIDLHPASGYTASQVFGLGETSAVGSATNVAGSQRPALWTGPSAASFVDLTPVNFGQGYALGTGGGQQVGRVASLPGTGASGGHAALWNGTAGSFVDLHPGPAYRISTAAATDGRYQVGYGSTTGSFPDSANRALLWSGTAASVIDLHALLPSTFTESTATAIFGDTVYGYGFDNTVGVVALTWTGVPEPASFVVLAAAGGLLLRRRRSLQLHRVKTALTRVPSTGRSTWPPSLK